MEDIGVDFSDDPSSSEMKNTLFVVDPTQPWAPKTADYGLPRYNPTATPSLHPLVWGEDINFKSFIKSETSMQYTTLKNTVISQYTI